jgi:hypothetical protein
LQSASSSDEPEGLPIEVKPLALSSAMAFSKPSIGNGKRTSWLLGIGQGHRHGSGCACGYTITEA